MTPSIFIGYSNPKAEISQAIQTILSGMEYNGLAIVTAALNGPDSSDQLPRPPIHESFIYAQKYGITSEDDRLREWGTFIRMGTNRIYRPV